MALPVTAVSPNIVISQVYGGGGTSGATFTHDFVELFNRGTTPVSLAGWSVQYTSATGTGNFGSATNLITELPGVLLAPGQYLLIQEAPGAGGTTPLSPDVTDTTPIALAAGAGKLALVNNDGAARMQRQLDALFARHAGDDCRSRGLRERQFLRRIGRRTHLDQHDRRVARLERLRRHRQQFG
jgi:hypothetical protein